MANDGWISTIMGSLPEEGVKVKAITCGIETRLTYSGHDEIDRQVWRDNKGTRIYYVTHWMPIPPLPTDEKAKE